MTEAEWLACTDPEPMLKFLCDKASERKLRLFAAACCRRILHLFSDKLVSQRTIEFAERFADGQGTENDLHGCGWGKKGQAHPVVQWKAWDAACNSADYGAEMVKRAIIASDEEMYRAREKVFNTAWLQQGYHLHEAMEVVDASLPAELITRANSTKSEEQERQSSVFRDIFANPFQRVAFAPEWLTLHVVELARAIYENRAFDRLPLLTNGLEEAGCTDAHILAHCRSAGPHVRGCWVIDLLLGKE